jgi:MFS family permease
MQMWAINWHVYGLTHKAISLGLIGLFRVVPIVLFSLLGGTVADAWDRRRVMLVTQSVLAAVAMVLGVLTWTNHINAYGIYGLTMVGAAATAFDNPARQSLIPRLVSREDLTNAISLNSVIMRTSTILGPLFAGVLIGRGNLTITYISNAISFIAVIAALLAMRKRDDPPQVQQEPEQERTPVSWGSLKEGFHFVQQTPILVWTIWLDFFATFFSSANSLLPIFARDILHSGARGYGVLAAAQAVGSLTAGVAVAFGKPFSRQGKVVLWSVFIYGIATVLFGASRWFLLSWLALALVGASDGISTILRQTIRQLVTPDRLRGRMTAFNMIFFMGGPQLGEFEAGLAANWLGGPWSVIVGGMGCLLTVGWVASRAPALRKYDSADSLGANI